MPNAIPSSSSTRQNLEGFSLIWYDPTIGEKEDNIMTLNQLREINDYVVFFTTEDDCIAYIESVEDEQMFLVTSGRCAECILRKVHDFKSIDSVFIFCIKVEKYQYLMSSEEFSKIIGVYNKPSTLIKSIKEAIQFAEKQMEVFSFYNQHEEKSTRDLSKESAGFLWFQMFKDMIMRLPRDATAKQQLTEYCRNYYRGNRKEIAFIDEFERDYTSDKQAIQWYTRQTFLYKLVNKAMRTEDTEQLHIFRFFIADLSLSLAKEYANGQDKDKHIVRLYRGLKMDKNEVLLLQQNRGNLISTNGFLSTTRSIKVAQEFAYKPTKRTNVYSVLYEIECKVSELGPSLIFADISQFSVYKYEEEVLFDIGATFQILSVTEKDQGQWFVHMKAVNEGVNIAKDFIELNRKEEEETSAVLIFGKLLQDTGLYDKSLKYFQNLLSNNSQNNDIARIYNLIGTAFFLKKDYTRALENYERSYNLKMKSSLPRIKDSARPLMNIGLVYHKRKDYNKATKLYLEALKIFDKYYGKNHLKTTKVLTNIGNCNVDLELYQTGLQYFEKVLKIQNQFLPADHMETAMTLNNIAVVYQKMNDVDHALEYYQRSLVMKQKVLPVDHPDIITTQRNIKTIQDRKPRREPYKNDDEDSTDESGRSYSPELHHPRDKTATVSKFHDLYNRSPSEPILHYPTKQLAMEPELHYPTKQLAMEPELHYPTKQLAMEPELHYPLKSSAMKP
ncbi:unnamed protein product [Adineta steineri]|uniref:NAD(P)(+)--arginine ADP-ribosyltransferase n=1 Tax=Adineta steineri TaxID=433720 RepID=A0A815IVG4_9BILA|nr:unnamed protein product [Adineta steineri]CAF3821277.1 unnamed protein product [Adineta steineri]